MLIPNSQEYQQVIHTIQSQNPALRGVEVLLDDSKQGNSHLYSWVLHDDGRMSLYLNALAISNSQIFNAVLQKAFNKKDELTGIRMFIENLRDCSEIPTGNPALDGLADWLRSTNPHLISMSEIVRYLFALFPIRMKENTLEGYLVNVVFLGQVYNHFKTIDDRIAKISLALNESPNSPKLLQLKYRTLAAKSSMGDVWKTRGVSLDHYKRLSAPPYLDERFIKYVFNSKHELLDSNFRASSPASQKYKEAITSLITKRGLFGGNIIEKITKYLIAQYHHLLSEEHVHKIKSIELNNLKQEINDGLLLYFAIPEELIHSKLLDILINSNKYNLLIDVRLLNLKGRLDTSFIKEMFPWALSRIILHHIGYKFNIRKYDLFNIINPTISNNIFGSREKFLSEKDWHEIYVGLEQWSSFFKQEHIKIFK